MKLLPLLPVLAVTLPLVTSCEDVKVKASDAMEAAAAGLERLAEEVRDLDLSGLSPEALREKGKELVDGLSDQLRELKDSDQARLLGDKLQIVVEKLEEARGRLGEQLPDARQLREASTGLRERARENPELEGIVQPLLDRIDQLLGSEELPEAGAQPGTSTHPGSANQPDAEGR